MTTGLRRGAPPEGAPFASLPRLRQLAGTWPAKLGPLPPGLVGVMAVGLSIRVLWAALMPVPPEADFQTFYQMATLIAQGQWWPASYGWLFQGPLYPTLLAPLAPFGETGLVGMRLLNAILQTGMIALAWLLARRTFGARSALLAGAIAAVMPGLWLYAPVLASEHLTVLLLPGATSLLAGRRSGRRPVLAGLLAGALVFTRPAFILLPVLLLAYLVWKRPREERWRAVRSYALGVALALAPFGLLNHAAGGPALPIGNAGWQQWLILNERATGQWFPVLDREDDPFEGLGTGELTDERVRGAQLKLATQYALANPGELPGSFVKRFDATWESDRHALEWTLGHTPEERNRRSGLGDWSDRLVDAAYLLLVALALSGAIAFRRSLPRLLPILIPIAYIVGIHLIAEGNARYHLPAVPFFAVLAAAAVARPRRAIRGGLLAALVVLQPWLPAAPIIILLVVLVPLGPPAVRSARAAARSFLGRPVRRGRLAGGLVLVGAFTVFSVVAARGALDELAAVDPAGWQAYRVAGGTRGVPSSRIVPSDVPGQLRRVSFPDAYELSEAPAAGGIVGAVRTLGGLGQEDRYTFYLQVWDPGLASERLVVSLNGRVVWKRAEDADEAAGWRYISVDWLADAPTATIAVERQSSGTAGGRGPVLIRNLHLYPAY